MTRKDIGTYICSALMLAGGAAMLTVGIKRTEPILFITGAIVLGIATIICIMMCMINYYKNHVEEEVAVVAQNPATVVPVSLDCADDPV